MAKVEAPIPDDAVWDNPFGDWAGRLDRYTEAHRIGVLVSFLAAFSAFIGNTPRIMSTGKATPLSFWPILIGLSGKGRKGTATNLALDICQRSIPSFMDGNLQLGFDSGLGIIQELHARIHGETNGMPEPILIVEEELSKLQELAKKDRRLGTNLTKLWDGQTLVYKTGKDFLEIKRPHAAFIGHVQPKLFQGTRNSKDAAGGTWNRYLFFWVERSKRVKIFGELQGFERVAEDIATEFRQAAHWARDVTRVRVPDHVAERFERVHRPAVEALTGANEEISEFAERALAYLLRIAALYALAEGQQFVQVKHFDSALALIRYSVKSLEYVLSGNRRFSGRTTLATKVLSFVQSHGPASFTKMTVHCGRGYDKNSYVGALLELDGEVILYTLPGKRRGAGGNPWYVATPEQLPADAIPMDITEVDPDDVGDEEDVTNHPNYRVQESTATPEQVKEESDDEPVEAEVVVDEPETPAKPLKALPAPKRPKTAPKPATDPTERLEQLKGMHLSLLAEMDEPGADSSLIGRQLKVIDAEMDAVRAALPTPKTKAAGTGQAATKRVNGGDKVTPKTTKRKPKAVSAKAASDPSSWM